MKWVSISCPGEGEGKEVDQHWRQACDGIWNSLSSQEVSDFITERLKKAENPTPQVLKNICVEVRKSWQFGKILVIFWDDVWHSRIWSFVLLVSQAGLGKDWNIKIVVYTWSLVDCCIISLPPSLVTPSVCLPLSLGPTGMIEKKPVGFRPEFRPIGLVLWILFSKKSEPYFQARGRPTSNFCSTLNRFHNFKCENICHE